MSPLTAWESSGGDKECVKCCGENTQYATVES